MENIKISLRQEDCLDLYNSKTPMPLSLSQKISKKPRYYQTNGIYKFNYLLEQGFKRLLFIMPTGTGKTLLSKLCVLSSQVRKTMGWEDKKKIRVLFIVHKKRLLRQASYEFADCEDIELITQSAFQEVPAHVIQAGWDITFVDEAHHEAMMSIQTLLEQLGDIPIVGFTANANRGDNLLVKFEKFIMPISKQEAIKEGFISEPGINTIIDTGKQDKTDIVIDLVKNYKQCMGNTIVFFKTNRECEIFHDFCLSENISAMRLDAKSSEKDLDYALDSLSEGRIQFLINCKKVDEGIDVLNCTDVILARNFGTEAEKEQLIGRAIRPDTPCTVWELTNPYIDSVEAEQVIGSHRFKRILYIHQGQWNEKLIEGVDENWGKESELRFEYIKNNLGFDPRYETNKKVNDLKSNFQSTKTEIDNPSDAPMTNLNPKDNAVDAVSKPVEKVKVTRRIIYDAVDNKLKHRVMKMSVDELKILAKNLRRAGKI